MALKVKSTSKLQPLGDHILIRPITREVTTRGGIVLPDTAKEKPQEGEVLAAGPGKLNDDGTRQQMEVGKGDKVIYAKYAGTEIKIGDEELIILRQSDVLAKYT
ncbi:MAG: co-chaperone GroES [Dehalococcoidia bacterium]|nr:MAG: co-chaperone GroES [Dehalococcoidia bacterium]